MADTVRDLEPIFDYARPVTTQLIKDPIPLLINYLADVDLLLVPANTRPNLLKFGSSLYIEGSAFDVIYGSAYIKRNPDKHYLVSVYEDPEVAEDRYESIHGHPYDADPYSNFELPKLEDLENDSMLNLLEGTVSSNVAIFLTQYIKTYDPDKFDKAPMLIGNTGIAKSAIVKSVVSDLDFDIDVKNPPTNPHDSTLWGYKIVDIRAGFLDKTDLLGFVETKVYKNKMAWSDSPKKELLICATEFVMQCRRTIIENGPTATDEDLQVLKKIAYYAKTPVLFLDEVNRSPKEIMNQIMGMVNTHKLNDYDISIAPIIAAVNMLEEETELPEDKLPLIDYLVTQGFAAEAGRFEKMRVTAADKSVIQSSYKYLLKLYGTSALCKQALDWADKNGVLYSIKKADQYGKFPTLRGWEDTCKYLTWIERTNNKWSRQVIQGCLGLNIEPSNFIKDKEFDPDQTSDEFVRHCLESGIPTILLGRLGVAKTAKVAKHCTATGHLVCNINLAAEDRTTVSGFPTKMPFITSLFRDEIPLSESHGEVKIAHTHKINDNAIFKKFQTDLETNHLVPNATTEFVPNEGILRSIDECRPHCSSCGWQRMEDDTPLSKDCPQCNKETVTWRKMILNFDEMNRPLTLDTRVKLLNGTNPTLKDIINEYGTSKYFWVYSSTSDGSMVPARARCLGITRKNDKIIKIMLDNGEYIKCSYDHPFMMRDGSFKNAIDLSLGDSLMPLYSRISNSESWDKNGYEEFFDNKTSKWTLTHYRVSNICLPIDETKPIVHHDNFNRLDNDPSNLKRVNNVEHSSIHGKQAHLMHPDLVSRSILSIEGMKLAHERSKITRNNSESFSNIMSSVMINNWKSGKFNDTLISSRRKTLLNRTINVAKSMVNDGILLTEDNYETNRSNYRGVVGRGGNVALSVNKIKEYFGSFDNFSVEVFHNHTITNIEYCDNEDVSCLYVEGYHNFALSAGVFVHNCHPIVQSAIFEAISDKRFRGASLKGMDYAVVATGNWENPVEAGDGGIYGVEKVDTASLHRFCSKMIEKIDENELVSFLEYLKDTRPRLYKIMSDYDKVNRSRLLEMLNYLPDATEDISLKTTFFSYREITELDNHLEMFNYSVLGNLYTNYYQALNVIRMKDYVLRARDPKRTVEWKDFSSIVMSPFGKVFKRGVSEVPIGTIVDYVESTIEDLIVTPPDDKEIDNKKVLVTQMLTSLKIIESETMESVLEIMKQNIPTDFIQDVMSVMSKAYEDSTVAKLSSTIVESMNLFDVNNVKINVDSLISSLDANRNVKEQFSVALIKEVTDSADKVPISSVRAVIDEYNNHPAIAGVDMDLNLMEQIELIERVIDNINIDKYEKVIFGEVDNNGALDLRKTLEKYPTETLTTISSYTYDPEVKVTQGPTKDVTLTNKDLVGKYLLDRFVILPDNNANQDSNSTVTFYNSKESKINMRGYYFANLVPLGMNKYVPDMYSIKCMIGLRVSTHDVTVANMASMSFDADIFKVKIKGFTGKHSMFTKGLEKATSLLYTYTGKVLWYDIVIKQVVYNVNPYFFHPTATNIVPVFDDNDLKNMDQFIDTNVQTMIGVLKTQDIYGGSLDDVPYKDKEAASKLKSLSDKYIDPATFGNFVLGSVDMDKTTNLELSNISLLYLRGFGRMLDKVFIG